MKLNAEFPAFHDEVEQWDSWSSRAESPSRVIGSLRNECEPVRAIVHLMQLRERGKELKPST
jgi:hypothetical protein